MDERYCGSISGTVASGPYAGKQFRLEVAPTKADTGLMLGVAKQNPEEYKQVEFATAHIRFTPQERYLSIRIEGEDELIQADVARAGFTFGGFSFTWDGFSQAITHDGKPVEGLKGVSINTGATDKTIVNVTMQLQARR